MKQVWWCSSCQVPLLTSKCEICGHISPKPVAKDLVPVFAEEMKMLQNKLGFSDLPNRPEDFYLWCSGTNYYHLGKKVASITYKTPGNPSLSMARNNALQKDISCKIDMRTVRERLYRANKSRVDSLEYEARLFISQTIEGFPKRQPLVAFSGGKDSTVVSSVVRRSLGSSEILHVFSDTTIEAPDTYQYIEDFFSNEPSIPLVRLRPSVDFLEMCNRVGPPSRIHRWCCTSHKTAPMGIFIDLISNSAGSLTFDGIRACESARRAKYDRVTLQHSKLALQTSASPLLNWNDLSLWIYILVHDLPFNRAYKRGFRRVGCINCPFTGDWAEFLTAECYPKHYGDWKNYLLSYARAAHLPEPESFAIDTWKGRARGEELDKRMTRLKSEDCLRESNTLTYSLGKEWSETVLDYLRPFGDFVTAYDDGIVMHGELVTRGSRHTIASIKVVRTKNTMRVTFGDMRNLRLVRQRFEKQLKKFQSCLLCGACVSACPRGAIVVNGLYKVATEKCTGCLKCVSQDCTVIHALGR